jgi:hypothetical protein
MVRKTGSALASVLRMGEQDGAHDRVLRTSFWLSSPARGCGEIVTLDSFRARREPTGT